MKKQPYSSAMIDLSQSEDFLRKQLSGKWRNQLCSAEKLDILIEIESGIDALMWLLKKYHEFKKAKIFRAFQKSLFIIWLNNLLIQSVL